jgi:hypothetical protein
VVSSPSSFVWLAGSGHSLKMSPHGSQVFVGGGVGAYEAGWQPPPAPPASPVAALEERELPTFADLNAAARDQAKSLARLLAKGDVERLREADGKSEREIAVEHRLRLLTHGLLLEYKTAQGIVVHAAPLLQEVLAQHGAP